MVSASSAEALLVEHLRYTPLSLIDDVINTINAIVYRAINAIESWMLVQPPASLGFVVDDDDPEEQQRMEIEEGVHRLETLLEATVDKTFDKFEIYTLRNLLHVPEGLESWVRLKHYEGLPLPLPPSAPTPASITQLRQKLHGAQQLNLTLSHTHASNEILLNQLKSILQPSSGGGPLSISSAPAPAPAPAPTPAPLQPSAQFTKAQLPALKSLLEELRPRLKSMSELAAVGARPGPGGDLRDERVRYVEGVVDRVVATQLGSTGEMDDGLGRRMAEEEVRAMERIRATGTTGTRGVGRQVNREDDDQEDEDEEMEE